MTKITPEFTAGVIKKMKSAGVSLESHTVYNKGWVEDTNLGKGSIEQIELKPQFKQLLKNCGISPTLDPKNAPSYSFRKSTGQEKLNVPWPQQCENEESFYRILFHELTHWSGREHRLKREMGELDCCRYHSLLGATEEITAELASVILAEHFGFVPNYERAAFYINGYLAHIAREAPDKDTRKTLMNMAASQAREAAEYLASLA